MHRRSLENNHDFSESHVCLSHCAIVSVVYPLYCVSCCFTIWFSVSLSLSFFLDMAHGFHSCSPFTCTLVTHQPPTGHIHWLYSPVLDYSVAVMLQPNSGSNSGFSNAWIRTNRCLVSQLLYPSEICLPASHPTLGTLCLPHSSFNSGTALHTSSQEQLINIAAFWANAMFQRSSEKTNNQTNYIFQ